MPKSKRAKVVHLSKVTKKGKELTLRLYANIRTCIEQYPYLFVFSVDNMRNTYLKDVRAELADSRLFFGKTKVMAKALGSSPEDETAPGTHLISPYLSGDVGLLFTSRPPTSILGYFDSFSRSSFARSGSTASQSFTIPAGTVYSLAGTVPASEDVPLAHSLEPTLRKLGVPSRLVKGKIELENEHVVCREGETLGSGQTTLLKMFGVAMAEFKIEVRCWWEKETGNVRTGEEGPGKDVETTVVQS